MEKTPPEAKHRDFDLDRLKRWHGIPPFVNEREEERFDEFVLSFEKYMDPMDPLIASLLYQYVLERYKMVQLMNWGSSLLRKQAQHFERLQEGASEDQRTEERKRDPESHPPSIAREFLAHPHIIQPMLSEAPRTFLREGFRKKGNVSVAIAFEQTLDQHVKLDAWITEAKKRAASLVRQIQALSTALADRLEKEMCDEIFETATRSYQPPA